MVRRRAQLLLLRVPVEDGSVGFLLLRLVTSEELATLGKENGTIIVFGKPLEEFAVSLNQSLPPARLSLSCLVYIRPGVAKGAGTSAS